MATAGRIVALCVIVATILLIAAVTLKWGPVVAREDAWLPRYDLDEASGQATHLADALAEVSGLAVDRHGRLLAHHDELSTVYVIDPATGAVLRTIRLGPAELRGDFEGVAVVDDRIFLATSGGTLLEIIESPSGGPASSSQVETGLGRVCEVEGLAYDAASAAFLLPCKTMWGKKQDDRLLVYAVPLATLALESKPRIDVAHAALRDAGLRGGFHPSAIEVHPRSGSLFIVAGRESAIVEVSADGRLLAARRLSRKAHRQPEGLAFGPGLELWIADEGARTGATLTRYRLAAATGGRQD